MRPLADARVRVFAAGQRPRAGGGVGVGVQEEGEAVVGGRRGGVRPASVAAPETPEASKDPVAPRRLADAVVGGAAGVGQRAGAERRAGGQRVRGRVHGGRAVAGEQDAVVQPRVAGGELLEAVAVVGGGGRGRVLGGRPHDDAVGGGGPQGPAEAPRTVLLQCILGEEVDQVTVTTCGSSHY